MTSPAGSRNAEVRHQSTTRSWSSHLRAVRCALKGEWIKLRSVRTTKAILALNAAGGILVPWALARFAADQQAYVTEVGFYWVPLSAILAAVVGILIFSSEGQHGTLGVTLAAQPVRLVIAFAKAVAAAASGVVLGAVGIAAGFAGGLIAGIEMGDTSSLISMTSWALLYTGLSAVLGLGIGMTIRHSAAAVTGMLVWGLMVEGLLTFVIPVQVGRYLPFLAGDRLLPSTFSLEAPDPAALTQLEAALVFGGYALLALAIGTALFSTRDVS